MIGEFFAWEKPPRDRCRLYFFVVADYFFVGVKHNVIKRPAGVTATKPNIDRTLSEGELEWVERGVVE